MCIRRISQFVPEFRASLRHSLLSTRLISGFVFLLSTTLGADTVMFRDGREITGVRTEIRGDQLTIIDSNGRESKYSMREVKSIRPGAISTPVPVKPEIPEQPGPKTRSWLDHPVSLAVQGLVPGWSGLFRSNHYAGGALMSGLELYAVARLIPWVGRPKPAIASNPLMQLLLLQTSSDSTNRTQTLGVASSMFRLVENPVHKSEYLLRDDFFRTRTERISALGLLLVTDATLSVLFRDTEKQISVYSSPTETSLGLKFSKHF